MDRMDSDTFRIQKSILLMLRVLTVIAVIGFLISCTISVGWWYFAFSHFGPAAIWRWSSTGSYLSILFALLVIFSSIALLRLGSYSLTVNEDGFSVHQGDRTRTVPWDQIASIRSATERYWLPIADPGSHSTIWLALESGKKLRFSDTLERFDAFLETVKSRTYPRLLRVYRDQLNRGQAIDFSGLSIEPTGIRIKKRVVLWSDVEGVSLENGKVILRFREGGKEKEHTFPIRRILNVDLCIQLIQNIELTS